MRNRAGATSVMVVEPSPTARHTGPLTAIDCICRQKSGTATPTSRLIEGEVFQPSLQRVDLSFAGGRRMAVDVWRKQDARFSLTPSFSFHLSNHLMAFWKNFLG
jgi:hypothetical protein